VGGQKAARVFLVLERRGHAYHQCIPGNVITKYSSRFIAGIVIANISRDPPQVFRQPEIPIGITLSEIATDVVVTGSGCQLQPTPQRLC